MLTSMGMGIYAHSCVMSPEYVYTRVFHAIIDLIASISPNADLKTYRNFFEVIDNLSHLLITFKRHCYPTLYIA